MNKPFKTFDEQIDILEERKLTVKNPNKLKWYLQTFNYQNFISGYNDPFMQNFTRSTNVYREDASDLAIIDLFNFDRSLSSLLFSNIKQVESQLNTAITHEIARVLNENNYPNGNILKALEDTNILPYIFQAGVNKDSIRKTLLGNFGNKETKLSKKYPLTDNDVPIWVLSIFWSFGDAIYIFKKMNKKLKRIIVEKYFYKKFENSDTLYKTLMWLKMVRNSACHNNVLYNLSTHNNSLSILAIIDYEDVDTDIASVEVKIYDVIRILDTIQNKTNKNTSLVLMFQNIINNFLVKKGNISNESLAFIFRSMNYKDNK